MEVTSPTFQAATAHKNTPKDTYISPYPEKPIKIFGPSTLKPCKTISSDQRHLESLTLQILTALNLHQYDSPIFDNLVPNFRSDNELINNASFHPQTRDQYLAKHKFWSQTNPNRRIIPETFVTDFDEVKGKADIWVWIKVHGWFGEGDAMCAESVSCFRWQRSQGVWWCHSHMGMRGVMGV